MKRFLLGLVTGMGLAAVPAWASEVSYQLPGWTVGKGGEVICKTLIVYPDLHHIRCAD